MKIVVCVSIATGAAVDEADAAIRAGTTPVSALREHDTHAVEQALRIAEARRAADPAAVTEIVAVALAPAEALGAVREALALGANRAVLLDDATLRGLDLSAVSEALARLLEHEPADLYLACTSSTDIDGLLMWNAVGARLSIPVLTQATTLDVEPDTRIAITRQSERGDQRLVAPSPCIVELSATINQARYPTIKGRAAAQNKPVALMRPDQLGIDPVASTTVLSTRSPERARTTTVVDDPATAAQAIVEFLRARRLA